MIINVNAYTPDEAMTDSVKDAHPYRAAIEYASEQLGSGGGRSLLVLGSPPAEANALEALGWQVTLVDWRIMRHPRWVQGDAMALTFGDATFDAVSSTCVLCHVGLGRYGDPVAEHGPSRMLAEIDRVLKPGGRVVLMPGPVVTGTAITMGTVHRVTTLETMADLTATWFRTIGRRVFQAERRTWLPPGEAITSDVIHPDYLCLTLERV